MCTADVNGIQLYYERHGTGEPLLFIGGLGANLAEIPYLIDAYSRHLEFIVFDGRGCGRSDKPEGDYSIPGFADDAAALLDALRIESAFVYGSSMGGMIAQELTLRHPARVRGLILGCTTAGAVRGVRPSAETVQTMIHNQSLTGDEALAAGWKLGYSEQYIASHWDALMTRSRNASRFSAPRESYMRQVIASARHDVWDDIGSIACPVMVIHGADDVMIPAGNALMLKERLPHAELHILDGMGHGYNLEAQEQADALVLDFVRRNASATTGEAARAIR
jgi:pimeloyl-ACP methyl ester carboxylesterase